MSGKYNLGGVMLLIVTIIVLKKKDRVTILFTKSWKNLLLASLFLSIGIFTWYDSTNRIGASKELLIAGPLEIVIIVLLARAFLKEKLKSIHIIGVALALLGFVLAIISNSGINAEENVDWIDNGLSNTSTLPDIFNVTFGDLEAIISSFGFALGVLFLTKLVSRHSPIEVAASSMLTSGLLLIGFMIVGVLLDETANVLTDETFILIHDIANTQRVTLIIVTLILFSLLPFIGSLSYSTGLSRIGASLTATIGSSSIIITLVAQLMLAEIGFPSNLPNNIYLSVLGGIIGFLGIYVIHMHDFTFS
ncbi:MAG TPA: EamA family transporter [Nitrososphaeraceae archaeon]|nr:EamA family transporter [Nitrososphaeraceae archaeon]